MNPELQGSVPDQNGSLAGSPVPALEPESQAEPDIQPLGPSPSAKALSEPLDGEGQIEIQNSTKPKNFLGPRSKIASLPKAIRDKLNFMLRDGLEHQQVLDALGDDAKGITRRNLSSWHTGPSYQHWLLEQEWLEDLRLRQESAFDLLNDFEAAKFNQAVLQLAISRLFLSFRNLESGELNENLGGNARTFANLVHALSRACRETTNIEKYRDACARVIAAELKQLNVDRDLSDREYELLVKKMDQVFRVARPSLSKPNKAPNGFPQIENQKSKIENPLGPP